MLQALVDGFLSHPRDDGTNSMAKQAKNGVQPIPWFLEGIKQRLMQNPKLNDLILHRIGKTKSYMVGGKGSQSFLVDKVFEQPLIKKIFGAMHKINPAGAAVGKEQVRSRLLDMGIGGTIAGGKSYIDRGMAGRFPGGVRDVVNHEAFHLKPVVGNSETLAHIVGGLRSRKGVISPMAAVKSYGHLWKTRASRALLEHGIVGGGVYGAAKGVGALAASDDRYKSSE